LRNYQQRKFNPRQMRYSLAFFFKKHIVLLCVLTMSFFISAQCQPPATLPTPESLNQPGINDVLQQNGINPTQLTPQNFKAYFEDNNQDKKVTGTDKNADLMTKMQNKSLDKDSTQKDNIKQSSNGPDQTYGSNVFKDVAMMDVSELSTPPLDYPIGVGDHIIVALWGGGEYQEDYVVARDGSIFPDHLGKIIVQGLTFETARSLIYSRFKSIVPTATNIEITLGQPRTINVNVGGEVISPGPITVSAFSNAFNVIGLAGGTTDYGNLRNIQVKRNGKIIETLDVYEYLNSGDLGTHIYLENNDFVLVTFFDKKVLATGQFKRPMYYQLKKDEGIKALIKYSGGFTPDAFSSGVKVIRTENEKQVIHDVNATAIVDLDNQDYLLRDGDIVKTDLIKPGIINKVEITGEVSYPGNYELRKGDRLFDVINRAGGITRNTFLQRAYIFRGAGDSTAIKTNKIEIDLSAINKDNLSDPNNVLLQTNDLIQLFSNTDFADQQFVEIFGEVRKEGKLKKYGGMTLQDLLYLSGGLKPSAEYGRLEISSVVDIDSARQGLKPTRNIVRSYAILPNLQLDSIAANVELRPYDQVFVRKNPTFQLQENVQVEGLVRYPGMYPRLDKKETLSSYIDRAGGIKDNANLSGAILFRSRTNFFRESILKQYGQTDSLSNALQNLKEPITIDLEKAMKYRNSKDDIILEPNDVIYVPEINPFVSVQGKVQSPLKITFDNDHTKLSYYIDKAGGFGIRPWRKRIYVTYASGKSRRTRNLFFIHFYPRVEEGSTVNVPERPTATDFSNTAVQALTTTVPILIGGLLLKYL
jgi:protein involved in polysaccharide export with SLBB domain